jgi:hypothetical protein
LFGGAGTTVPKVPRFALFVAGGGITRGTARAINQVLTVETVRLKVTFKPRDPVVLRRKEEPGWLE